MKSFTLISGILITLLGVFFFANPTNLLAIVGWLFALVMLVSGVSSLMVYFKRDNENRSFFQLLQSIIIFSISYLSIGFLQILVFLLSCYLNCGEAG